MDVVLLTERWLVYLRASRKQSQKYRTTFRAIIILRSSPLLTSFGSIRNYEAIEERVKSRLCNLSIRILELRYEPRMDSASNN